MIYVADATAPRLGDARRLVVANFDAELTWARETEGVHSTLPRDVAAAAAAAGLTMALLTRPGDRVWLGHEVDLGRLQASIGSGIDLASGDVLDAAEGMDELICWGWTGALASKLHATGAPAPACVARWNDRRTSLALEQELGLALPESRLVDSRERLADVFNSWPHPRPWVLKAPLSASGRARLRRRGAPEADAQVRARRLLDRFGVLILEPWNERTSDCGCVGVIDDAGWRLQPPHRLHVDGNGVFRAIEIGDSAVSLPLAQEVSRVAAIVARRMSEDGYRGPFGIDAYSFEQDGERLRPLCEINARMTFGHLAHAARDRLGSGEVSSFTLEVARGDAKQGDSKCLLTGAAPDFTTVAYRWSP